VVSLLVAAMSGSNIEEMMQYMPKPLEDAIQTKTEIYEMSLSERRNKLNPRILEILGKGSFGAVFRVRRLSDDKKLAMKCESYWARRKILQHEAKVYESLRRIDSPHFITLEDRGRLPSRFIFVVMKLVGSTLWDLRIKSPERKFSMVTSIRAAEQTLAGIRDLHLCGYIHRDIKPPNFAIGREEDGDLHTIYIIDFGLSRKYRTENNDLRHEREKVPFRGTTRYASISALELKEQSRKDDVESWWYMVLEWMIGELPWQKIKSKDHDTVRQRKMELREEKNLKKVLEGTPEEYMTRIILYIDTLEYASVPDYDHIAALLEAAMEAYDLKYADPPDWDLMVAYLGPRYEKDPHYTLKS
ncbi:hypothetical protein V3C99_005885, partial [Haemonchus contortus]